MKTTLLRFAMLFCLTGLSLANQALGEDKLIEITVSTNDLEFDRHVSGGPTPEQPEEPYVVRDRLEGYPTISNDFCPGDRITIRLIYDAPVIVNAENLKHFAQILQIINTDELPGSFFGDIVQGNLFFLNANAKVVLDDSTEIATTNGSVTVSGMRNGNDVTTTSVTVHWVFHDLFDVHFPDIESAAIRSFEVTFDIPVTVDRSGQTYSILPMHASDVDFERTRLDGHSELIPFDTEFPERIPSLISNSPLNTIDDLIELIDLCNLATGIANSLDAKIGNAIDSFNAENAEQRADSVNKLFATVNAIEAQRGNQIDEACADDLIAAVIRVIDAMILFQ